MWLQRPDQRVIQRKEKKLLQTTLLHGPIRRADPEILLKISPTRHAGNVYHATFLAESSIHRVN